MGVPLRLYLVAAMHTCLWFRVYIVTCVLIIPYGIFFRSALQWRHIECDGVLIHRCLQWLLNCWFRRRPKKTSKVRVTGLCVGNSPVTAEFPTQKASNAENVSIWWCHLEFGWLTQYCGFYYLATALLNSFSSAFTGRHRVYICRWKKVISMCRCTKIGKILNFQNADAITHHLPVRLKPSYFCKDCLDTYCICRYIISLILAHRIS